MAANVSEHWSLVVEAATQISGHVRDRGWRFREHYQSVNSLAYLWAWYFAALRWRQGHNLKELEKDSLHKSLAAILDAFIDRWLICSQWAGVWATASAQSLSGYATRLATCVQELGKQSTLGGAIAILRNHLQSEVSDLNQQTINGLNAINADDRQQVRIYYTALWLWNRLDQDRWRMAKLALRQQSRRQNSLDVDHIVACDLWQSKLDALSTEGIASEPEAGPTSIEDLPVRVNEIGNCMLLEKNFNISKSNRPLKEFLDGVHEFKEGTVTLEEWAKALDLEMPQIDSAVTAVEVLGELFIKRSKKIRTDLEQFIRGGKERVDIETG